LKDFYLHSLQVIGRSSAPEDGEAQICLDTIGGTTVTKEKRFGYGLPLANSSPGLFPFRSIDDSREVYARLLELRLPITRAGAKRSRGSGRKVSPGRSAHEMDEFSHVHAA
jgi:hypothetical protein